VPDVSSVIVQTFKDKSFGLTIAEPNTGFKPASRTPYVELKSFEATNKPSDLKHNDERSYIFQIELNYPIGTGDAAVKLKSNEILESYSFNDYFQDVDYRLYVTEKREKQGYAEKAWYRKILQIYFRAFVSR